MGTKNNPGSFDCYANAKPDEPMFILLGRDPHAPNAVRSWAMARVDAIIKGTKPESDRAMVSEAMACANAMDTYRKSISTVCTCFAPSPYVLVNDGVSVTTCFVCNLRIAAP